MSLPSFKVSAQGHETSLSPSEIDRELSTMWKPADDPESPSLTRVVLGNVIWVGAKEWFDHANKTFQKVIPKYPCRLFLLIFDPSRTGEQVKASVSAQCFRPEAGKPPICCEIIHMEFGAEGVPHIRGCVAPLLISDLQTTIWRGWGADELDLASLESHADQEIILSSRAENPAQRLRMGIESPIPCFDLSWFRMKSIREQVTNFFDDPGTKFDLRAIRSIRIHTGSRAPNSSLPEVMGAIFVGWLASCLDWQQGQRTDEGFQYHSPSGPVMVNVQQCAKAEDAGLPLSTIEMTDSESDVFKLSFAADQSIELTSEGADSALHVERHLNLSEIPESEAMGMALNLRPSITEFLPVAKLALPLLETFCGGGR